MKMMKTLRAMIVRFAGLFRRKRHEAEMNDELRAHLDGLIERNVAAGMSPDDARQAAQRQFGTVEPVKERCRDQRRARSLEQWVEDLRFVLRSLNRAPSFSLATVITLALGIGAATLVLNLAFAYLFKPLPYLNPSELFAIGWKDKWTSFEPDINGRHLLVYREQVDAFSEYIAIEGRMANVVVGDEPIPGNHVAISLGAFRALGVTIALGREFLSDEFVQGADDVVIITDALWRKAFNADPAVLGRTLLIDQRSCTVVGVLGKKQGIPFRFQGEVYRPLTFWVGPKNNGPGIHIVGRLRAGVSVEAAQAALAAVRFPTPEQQQTFVTDRTPVVRPIRKVDGNAHWWVLLAGGIFLFGIACLNAMNLMLVRLLRRSRELGIRAAIGGNRAQILRLVFIEGSVLVLAAASVVLLVARLWFEPLFMLLFNSRDMRFDLFADWVTLSGVAGLGLVATAAMVTVPTARLMRVDLSAGLKAGSPGVGETRNARRMRDGLVILQAALAVILLVGTGLMMRSVQKLRAVDLGFDPTGKMKVWLAFPRGTAPRPEARLAYFEQLRQRVSAIPGVRSVASGEDALMTGGYWAPVQNDVAMPDGTFQTSAGSIVSAGYAETAGLHLKRGRWLSGREGDWEVVLNEALARARFPGEDPIGRSIRRRASGDREYRVVGVVRDARDILRMPAGMRFYLPDWIAPANVHTLLLRLDRDPEPEFKGVIRRAIYAFDPKVVTNYAGSINELIGNSVGAERFTLVLLRALAAVALALAALGLFSVMAYSVGARTREFGVRLALGAAPRALLRMVLAHGVATTAFGMMIGIVAAAVLTRAMTTLLFETNPYDPWVYGTMGGVLLLAAFLACLIPARQATRVDPMTALRAE